MRGGGGRSARGSRGKAGGRAGAVGCSIGVDVRSRRTSRAEGDLWAAVGGAGSRRLVVEDALSLDVRGRWGVLIGIGAAFRCLYSTFWSLLERTFASAAESLMPYWVPWRETGPWGPSYLFSSPRHSQAQDIDVPPEKATILSTPL